MKRNFKQGDIVTIVINNEYDNSEKYWTIIFKYHSTEDVIYYLALDNQNHIYFNNNYEYKDGDYIRYATKEESNNLITTLKNKFIISYPIINNYIPDSTIFNIENWLINILDIDAEEYNIPEFIDEIKMNIWNKLLDDNINKFNPKNFKPFDKVLVKINALSTWECEFFGRYDENSDNEKYKCINGWYSECIPFNKETEYLLGTTENPPLYYII